MWHAYWSLSMPLPNIIKIVQTIKKIWSTQEFGLKIRSVEIIRKQQQKKKKKKKKKQLSFLHETLLHDLIYAPTKYYQIISNSMEVMTCTSSVSGEISTWWRKWDLIFLHMTPLLVLLYVSTKYYQNISNYQEVMDCIRIWLRNLSRGDNKKK